MKKDQFGNVSSVPFSSKAQKHTLCTPWNCLNRSMLTNPLDSSLPNIPIFDVTIRGFQESDAHRVKDLFRAGMESLLPSFCKLALLEYPVSRVVWACSAGIMVVLAITDQLQYTPTVLVAALVYIASVVAKLRSRLAAFITSEIESNLVDIHRSYKGGTFLVAVYQDIIIGMVGGENRGNGIMEMKRMSVDTRIHSRGLGTRLVQALHDQAKQLGYSKISLATTSAQQPAIRLYRKFGYELMKESPLGVPGVDLCIFEKDLHA